MASIVESGADIVDENVTALDKIMGTDVKRFMNQLSQSSKERMKDT